MGDYEAENMMSEGAQLLGNPADDFSYDYEIDAALRAQVAAQLRRRTQSPAGRGRRSSRDPEDDDVRQELLTEDAFIWSGYVAAASAFDMLSSFIVSTVAFVYGYRTHSISLVCLGMQAIAHMLTSILLVIRFTSERRLHRWASQQKAQAITQGEKGLEGEQFAEDTATMLKRQRRLSLSREQGLHIAMGLVMLLSSVGLAYMAFSKIEKWNTWYEDHAHIDAEAQYATEGCAWYGFSVYFLQAIFRGTAAGRLRRNILWHGFSASIVSLLFLFVLGFSASYQKEWSWRAEPFAALCLSLATLIEGMRLLIYFSEDVDLRMSWDPRA